MGIVAAVLLIITAVVVMKILGFLLKTGFFVLTLPLKIIGALFAVLIGVCIFIPLGLVGAVIAVTIAPLLVLFILFLPVLLIALGIVQLLKNS